MAFAPLVVVSDLHIQGADDPLYRWLVRLLEQAPPHQKIALLGDVFDVWVGSSSHFTAQYARFLEAAAAFGARGGTLIYVEGNHDFLIHRALGSIPGHVHHAAEAEALVERARIYLAHGDLADPNDLGYRRLRRALRSRPVRALAACVPGKWIDRIGRRWSRYGRIDPRAGSAQALAPSRRDELRVTYRNFARLKIAEGYDCVVLGHCHDPDEFAWTMGDRTGRYYNVGFPRVDGTYLVWNPVTLAFERKSIELNENDD